MHPIEPVELRGDLAAIEPLRVEHAAGLLAAADAEEAERSQPQIVHRVYRLDRDRARELFDGEAAVAVPDTGIVVSCGPGEDHPAGADPDREKRALEAEHCDPAIRERLIAALARSSGPKLRMQA